MWRDIWAFLKSIKKRDITQLPEFEVLKRIAKKYNVEPLKFIKDLQHKCFQMAGGFTGRVPSKRRALKLGVKYIREKQVECEYFDEEYLPTVYNDLIEDVGRYLWDSTSAINNY